MKKAAVLVVLASLLSAHAYATKAREQSLLGAVHLVDSQSIFTYTADILQLGSYLPLEFGPTADGTTEPKAEGGLFRKNEDGSVYGLYLGHHDATIAGLRTNAGYSAQSNPVQGFYGKDNWAATLGVSNSEDKNTQVKETTVSAGFGQTLSNLSWGVNAHLLSNVEKPNATSGKDKFNGAPLVTASVRQLGQTYFHGGVTYGMLEDKVGGVKTDVKPMNVSLGFVDRTLGSEQTDLYYGITVNYSDTDQGGKHLKSLTLPVSIGLEHPVNSWATVRGSIQQNVLLGSTKDETAAPNDKEASVANNTTVAAGLGLKYGGVTLDGVLAAATTGNINGNAVLARAGVIYNF